MPPRNTKTKTPNKNNVNIFERKDCEISETCNTHILTQCVKYHQIRRQPNMLTNLKEILIITDTNKLILYLKATGL